MSFEQNGYHALRAGRKALLPNNYVAVNLFYVKSADAVPSGHHFLGMEFEPTGKPAFAKGQGAPGTVKLFVDGKEVGSADLPMTTPNRLAQGGAMLVGADTGSSINPKYKAPFHFTGTIKRVIVDVSGERVEDYETAMRVFLAKQ